MLTDSLANTNESGPPDVYDVLARANDLSLTRAMLSEEARGWVPSVIGAIALLLAIDKVRWLVILPGSMSEELLLGVEFHGWMAWSTSILLMLLLAWISAASFRHRRAAVWWTIGYCLYLAISYWVWLLRYSPLSLQTNLISGAFFFALMLGACRFLFDRRHQFDQR